ncbi:MAG: hypothetical protein AAF235_07715, partial [Planctomycetota bacterium]
MRFETSQSMKLGQQMKLAPRMIQSMEILQMPLAELEERIELELSSNPTLELGDGIGEAAEAQEGLGGDISGEQGDAFDAEGSPQELSIDESGREDFARLDEFGADNPEAAENAFEEDGDRAHGTEDAAPQSDRWESLRDDSYRPSSRLSGERDAKSEAMAQTA